MSNLVYRFPVDEGNVILRTRIKWIHCDVCQKSFVRIEKRGVTHVHNSVCSQCLNKPQPEENRKV